MLAAGEKGVDDKKFILPRENAQQTENDRNDIKKKKKIGRKEKKFMDGGPAD